MVPEGTKSAASLPRISAARSCRRLTVGSSRWTSSPTSASAIARRMARVGLVTVSLRRSIIPFLLNEDGEDLVRQDFALAGDHQVFIFEFDQPGFVQAFQFVPISVQNIDAEILPM